MVRIIFLFMFLFLATQCSAQPADDDPYAYQRRKMVERQIMSRGIKDPRVLEAMRQVKRHLFVPPSYSAQSYEDHPLPIGEGQTISQPYIVGLMTELLDLDGSERVLEIGTGSGYQAAILGELAQEVYTIEIVEKLANRSALLLQEIGYENIQVRWGDGYKGWPEQAPFDAIIVTAAPKKIPPALVQQLKEGGRLVVPVGDFFQTLKLVIKKDGRLLEKSIIPVRFVPMVHEKPQK